MGNRSQPEKGTNIVFTSKHGLRMSINPNIHSPKQIMPERGIKTIS